MALVVLLSLGFGWLWVRLDRKCKDVNATHHVDCDMACREMGTSHPKDCDCSRLCGCHR